MLMCVCVCVCRLLVRRRIEDEILDVDRFFSLFCLYAWYPCIYQNGLLPST